MKVNFKLMMACLAMMTVGLVGCTNEEGPGGPGGAGDNGAEGSIALTLVDGNTSVTRGAGSNAQAAVGNEIGIDWTNDLKVVIFENNNAVVNEMVKFEEVTPATTPKTYKSTKTFSLSAGNKYVYILANEAEANIPDPETATSRIAWERSIKDVTITSSAPATPGYLNIAPATTNGFRIGTMWREMVTVLGTSTDVNPEVLGPISVGRAAAKVVLSSVAQQAGTVNGLKGQFTLPRYAVQSVAKKFYMVGQYDGNLLPTNNGVYVTSAVHEKPAIKSDGSGGWVLNDADFMNYADNATELIAVGNVATNFFYVSENTTKKMDSPDGAYNNRQYFGNTTHIQLETKYVPHADEIYDAAQLPDLVLLSGGSSVISSNGGTFYVAIAGDEGLSYIFAQDPSQAKPALYPTDDHRIKYTGGLNYYTFAVSDPNEANDELKNRVLRNHYYDVSVTAINSLGDDSFIRKPEQPLPTTSIVEITVRIADWNKITSPVVIP
ncbi:Mfa1 family fimbria major subunit [Parabacteroides sp. PF5-9]|uniref:Mfa1 family fimbria major subunit n=1 Tax=Parabacteroides sp. PF5-9 TaxID=1742404 RepID=UPI0024770434|nr:Mfa1 family fimbria major subunit [Parabacteroides sp. PF5-9]MDH6358992.1 hypothetical protein [Parabacteroides sp. PF5-9]